MTAVSDHALVLDHAAAYAAAVRGHLDDLSPEQVDDLTDGLEADLAEGLEDGAARHVPVGAGGDASATVMLDLTARFGPAAAYADELRAAAGLGPRPAPTPAPRLQRASRLRDAAVGVASRLVASARRRLAPVLAAPAVRWASAQLGTLRPLWWVVRGWAVYAIGMRAADAWTSGPAFDRYVPRTFLSAVLLLALVALSVRLGRAGRPTDDLGRPALAALNVLALVAVPVFASSAHDELAARLAAQQVVYVETPVYQPAAPPEDGVRVDGMLVSNLFVYDAEGNPLDDVQIFDDRGRQVRTTYDDGFGDWALPGVDEPWAFGARTDADGRARWNVYPLRGAPVSRWTTSDDGARTLDEGELRTPPAPFAKAPALLPEPTASPTAP
ncbi:HAAS signaling domain-containing protein [Actinotalea solisilvae]|uniref:HAAS signaling domain-containing protein n=1 Tax=Actinotalea solisilvae TaxID=2072922 RepID=UPI0018F26F78|nr:hypothetical protein [Actinotalea solisilvae]